VKTKKKRSLKTSPRDTKLEEPEAPEVHEVSMESGSSDPLTSVESPLLNDEVPVKNKRMKKRTTRTTRRVKKPIQEEDDNMPNYNSMTEEEKIVHANSFKLKFDVLRKWHPQLNIESGIENNPNLYVVHKLYEIYLTHIYKEINSNSYRGYLLLAWLGLELFGTHILGLDLKGYTEQQINLMWAYEPILNELSTVNFYSIVEGWTPFQKLIGMVCFSYIFMIVIKLIIGYFGKKYGMSLDGFANTITTFITNMVISKPQTATMAPIVIQSNGGSAGIAPAVELDKIHNVQIPQAYANNINSQIGLATGALNIINTLTGKRGTTPVAPSVPVQNIIPPTSLASRIRPPTFTG
jgi:hypothetical protein